MNERRQQLDLGRSLLVTVVIRLVRERTQPVLVGIGVVGVATLVAGVVLLDGWLAVLLVAIAACCLVVSVLGFALRRVVMFGLAKLAPPADLQANQAAFDRAVDELGLPLGPISTPRFALRLRRGVDTELDRMAGVLVDLKGQLDADG